MRPVELVLENFGAYRAEARVDFGKLGPLFLVWGKTGSGKTTLFDALAYALYGAAPGSRGALPLELGSHYAGPGEAPRVEFSFALGDRLWRARRSPPHRRPGRGGKTVEEGQKALLESWKEGAWSVEAEGVREVTERVVSLLGLSAEEFSKIILLPQGEFQRFLEMASTERVAILEKLFPVELHDRVTALAVEKAKAALAEARRLDAELLRLAALGGGAEGETELARLEDEARGLEASRNAALEARMATERALERGREDGLRREAFEAAKARLAAAEVAAPGLAAARRRLEAARRAASLLPRLDEAGRLEAAAGFGASGLEARRLALAEVEGRRQGHEEELARAAALGEEMAALDQEAGGLAVAIEAWTRLGSLQAAHEVVLRGAAAAESSLAAAMEAEVLAQARLAGSRVSAAEGEAIQEAFEARRGAFEAAKLVEKAVELLARAEEAAGSGLRSLETARAALLPLEARLAEAEAEREGELAAELAAGLETGLPCPVCGSLDHPRPAGRAGSGAGGTVLEGLRRDREAGLAEIATAEAHAARDAEALARARAALAELVGPGRPLPGLDEARSLRVQAQTLAGEAAARQARVIEARREAESQAAALEAARRAKEGAGAALSEARALLAGSGAALEAGLREAGEVDPRPRAEALAKRRAELEAERGAALDRAAAWEAEAARAGSLLAEAEARQPLLEAAAAEGRLRAEAARIEAGFAGEPEAREASLPASEAAALEEALRRGEEEAAAARAGAEAAERALGNAPEADLAALEAEASAAAVAYGELQAACEEQQGRRLGLASLVAERRRIEEERRSLDAGSGRLAALADLLAGNLAPRRLPFKNFVLGAYFRAVVERASLRLFELSDGRFSLSADEGQGGRGRVGLDLLVQDSYTGRKRPSGTLSGGERFLSSLALALGLADTIRSRSGGVSLDAVFIDEGFGSLDEEALDRAIAALDRARGGRMVGIVSHVAELRNRIPSRIEVRKGRGGSSLTLV